MIGMTPRERIMDELFVGKVLGVSLHSGDPGRNGASEIPVRRQLGAWVRGGVGAAMNVDALHFTNMPAVTVTHFGVWEDTGSFLWGGELEEPKAYKDGDAAWVPPGALTVVLT